MYNFTRILILSLGCYFIISCGSTATKDNKSSYSRVPSIPKVKKLVVLVLPRKNVSDRYIENQFIQGLINKNYTVTSRSDLPKLEQEHVLQNSVITESDAAVMGKILNADAVLIVEVTELVMKNRKQGGSYISRVSMAARLVNVETANILWIRSKTESSNVSITNLVENVITLPLRVLGQESANKLDTLIDALLNEFPYRV